MDIDWDVVVSHAGGQEGGVGRPHFAQVLVEMGAAEDIQDAFDRYLADGKSAYVPKARITPPEVIQLAKASGGVAVLAHPLSLGLDPGPLERPRDRAGRKRSGRDGGHLRALQPDRAQGAAPVGRPGRLVATGGRTSTAPSSRT